jgi:phosphate transport system ATP-binding protein
MAEQSIDAVHTPVLETRGLGIRYGDFLAVTGVSFSVHRHRITAIIGPSGCGKTTLLRSFNRMNELVPGTSVVGKIFFEGQDLYEPSVDPVEVRYRIGMVFQKANPFPKSIYENIAWGARIHGYRGNYDELVESCLRQAALWDEVKDKLGQSGLALSGGQQQRLCIARALGNQPEVLLMDEPCSALDPIATQKVEELIFDLKQHYTIVIVTHNMQQAARVSDYTGFFHHGELIEFDETERLFTKPQHERTEAYITGRFG